MKKVFKNIKKKSITYFIITISFCSIFSYFDYNSLNSGYNFHELSGIQRNLIRINTVGTFITNPVSLITIPYYVGSKPRVKKNKIMSLTLFLSIIPSYLIWLIYFGFRYKITQGLSQIRKNII